MKENSGEDKYAANARIDELLNSFIDGELTAAQQAQVEDLISQDVQIAQRLRQLQKCKMLVGSLPRAQIPFEVAEGIRAQLELPIGDLRSSIFNRSGRPDGAIENRKLVRRVLAAAAMIGLVAVLAAVIYTILTPQAAPERPVAIESRQVRPAMADATPVTGFSGRLELKTDDLTAVSTFVNRAIEDKGISEAVLQDKHIYSLSCTTKQFNALLADLQTIWPGLDSATLFVNTEVFGEPVPVNNVTTAQIAQIAEQNSFQKRIEVAKGFDAMNTLVARLPDREIQSAIDGTKNSPIREWRAPKPILTTSDRKPATKSPSEGKEQQTIHLTIVVNR
jgi:anti-sigma-K factor RskA